MSWFNIPATNVLRSELTNRIEIPSIPILDIATVSRHPFTLTPQVESLWDLPAMESDFMGRLIGPITTGGICIIGETDSLLLRVLDKSYMRYPEAPDFRRTLPEDRNDLIASADPLFSCPSRRLLRKLDSVYLILEHTSVHDPAAAMILHQQQEQGFVRYFTKLELQFINDQFAVAK